MKPTHEELNWLNWIIGIDKTFKEKVMEAAKQDQQQQQEPVIMVVTKTSVELPKIDECCVEIKIVVFARLSMKGY
jgi:hypothetical protein